MKFLLITLLSLFYFAAMGQTTVTRDTIRVNGTDSVTVFVTTTTTVTRTFSYPEKTTIVTYYKLPNGTTPPPNQLPTCSAGSPQTITLPVNSIALSGSAEDADGKIIAVVWSKLSGGNAVIVSPTTLSTSVTNLVQGTYNFRLSVTDNDGGNCQSNVTVIVNPSATTGYSLILSNNADSQSDLDPRNTGQAGNGYIDTEIKLTGAAAFRSRPAEVSAGVRSEIQYSSGDTPNEGAIEWDMFYTYIAKGSGIHVTQVHPGNNSGSASIALWHSNGKFDVVTNDGSSNTHQSGTLMTIQTGHWYHMRFEYKMGTGAYLRWYVDGQLYFQSKTGVKIPSGGFFKWGTNGGFFNATDVAEAKKSDISYDNLKIYKFVP